MNTALDALALVKDAKKFEVELKRLAKAQKGAATAVVNARRKASEIIGEAGKTQIRAVKLLADAAAAMTEARDVYDDGTARCLAAKEESQRASAHEGRLTKAKAKLDQDKALLKRERGVQEQRQVTFVKRVKNFEDSVAGLVASASS